MTNFLIVNNTIDENIEDAWRVQQLYNKFLQDFELKDGEKNIRYSPSPDNVKCATDGFIYLLAESTASSILLNAHLDDEDVYIELKKPLVDKITFYLKQYRDENKDFLYYFNYVIEKIGVILTKNKP